MSTYRRPGQSEAEFREERRAQEANQTKRMPGPRAKLEKLGYESQDWYNILLCLDKFSVLASIPAFLGSKVASYAILMVFLKGADLIPGFKDALIEAIMKDLLTRKHKLANKDEFDARTQYEKKVLIDNDYNNLINNRERENELNSYTGEAKELYENAKTRAMHIGSEYTGRMVAAFTGGLMFSTVTMHMDSKIPENHQEFMSSLLKATNSVQAEMSDLMQSGHEQHAGVSTAIQDGVANQANAAPKPSQMSSHRPS